MIDLARRHPELVRLNRGSLDHPKATVVAADARRMLAPKLAFDALVFDFPSISDGRKFAPLYSVPLYRDARRALAPDGILVTQVTDFPWHLERTVRHLGRVFPVVEPMQVDLGNSVFNFVAASARPLRGPETYVSSRTWWSARLS